MKKKSTSQSAFFNLRVLIGLFVVLAGAFLALIGLGTFSGLTASSAQAQQNHKIINVEGLPPGFDCATIHDNGIDKQENFRAGAVMIACGEAQGGSASSYGAFSRQLLDGLTEPLAFGGTSPARTAFRTPPSLRHTLRPTRTTPTRSLSPTTIPELPPPTTPAHHSPATAAPPSPA